MISSAGAATGAAITNTLEGIFGAAEANKGYKQYIEQLNKTIAARRDHRDKVWYQDPPQTAKNQAAVTQTKELLDAKTDATRDRNIVTGGTDEAVALDKQAAAATAGNMLQQQAASGQERKDRIWSEDQQQIDAFNKYKGEAQMAQKLNKAQAIVNMGQAAGQAQIDAAKSMPW